MTPLTKKQLKALGMIYDIEEHFGSRWFTQAELPGITMHTVYALLERGHLKSKWFKDVEYYKLIATVERV